MPHIAAAATWLGLDVVVVVAVLVFTAPGVANPATAAFCFRALEVLAIWPMALAAPDSLLTGLLLGRGRWCGLLRHWWVAVKLAMNLLLTALVVVLLRPGLHDAADGRRIAGGLPASSGSFSLMFPSAAPASAPGLRDGAAGVRAVGPDPPDHGNGQAHGE